MTTVNTPATPICGNPGKSAQTKAISQYAAELTARFTYNRESGEILSLHGEKVGTLDGEGYIRVSTSVAGRWSYFRAHRFAWLAIHGTWPTGDIDHINGNRSDNRWSNLRLVDRTTNSENQRKARTNSKTGILGVYFDSGRNLWHAQIQVKGRNKNLGRFASVEDAKSAYLNAKRQFHAGCTI